MAEKKSRGQSKRRPTKDRVLQARIPEQLDDELRDRAEHLGMSVSTIVRNVLLHTFELVEGVVTDSAQVGRALQGRAPSTTTPVPQVPAPTVTATNDAAAVVAWQEATLNLNAVCDTCNVVLSVGERAALGLPLQARPVALCLECLATLSPQPAEQAIKTKPAPKARVRIKRSST